MNNNLVTYKKEGLTVACSVWNTFPLTHCDSWLYHYMYEETFVHITGNSRLFFTLMLFMIPHTCNNDELSSVNCLVIFFFPFLNNRPTSRTCRTSRLWLMCLLARIKVVSFIQDRRSLLETSKAKEFKCVNRVLCETARSPTLCVYLKIFCFPYFTFWSVLLLLTFLIGPSLYFRDLPPFSQSSPPTDKTMQCFSTWLKLQSFLLLEQQTDLEQNEHGKALLFLAKRNIEHLTECNSSFWIRYHTRIAQQDICL